MPEAANHPIRQVDDIALIEVGRPTVAVDLIRGVACHDPKIAGNCGRNPPNKSAAQFLPHIVINL